MIEMIQIFLLKNIKSIMGVIGLVILILVGFKFILKKKGILEKKYKKLLNGIIIFFILSMLVSTGAVYIMGWAISGFYSIENLDEGEDTIITDIGDEFVLKYETSSWLEGILTNVDVFDKTKKKKLLSYIMYVEYYKPEISTVIKDADMICYEIENCLICKKNGEKDFKGINFEQSALWDKKAKDFNEVAKLLVSQNEWKWIKVCGEFLFATGDMQIRETLERYAQDKFDIDELINNKDSGYSKEDMISFSKELLEKEQNKKSND